MSRRGTRVMGGGTVLEDRCEQVRALHVRHCVATCRWPTAACDLVVAARVRDAALPLGPHHGSVVAPSWTSHTWHRVVTNEWPFSARAAAHAPASTHTLTTLPVSASTAGRSPSVFDVYRDPEDNQCTCDPRRATLPPQSASARTTQTRLPRRCCNMSRRYYNTGPPPSFAYKYRTCAGRTTAFRCRSHHDERVRILLVCQRCQTHINCCHWYLSTDPPGWFRVVCVCFRVVFRPFFLVSWLFRVVCGARVVQRVCRVVSCRVVS